jgi:hypothetical protein
MRDLVIEQGRNDIVERRELRSCSVIQQTVVFGSL